MYRDVLGSFFSSIGFLYNFIWFFFSSSFFFTFVPFSLLHHTSDFFLDPCLMCFQIPSSIRFSHSSNHTNFFLPFFIFFLRFVLGHHPRGLNRTLKKEKPRSISRECSVGSIYKKKLMYISGFNLPLLNFFFSLFPGSTVLSSDTWEHFI